MSQRTEFSKKPDGSDAIKTLQSLSQHTPRGPKVILRSTIAEQTRKQSPDPIPPAMTGGRICIIDSEFQAADDLSQVLESMGHETLVITEMIGASNRIRAFEPDLLIIDSSKTALPGPRLLEVLKRNLGELPPVVFFTDMPREEFRGSGLGDQECIPRSSGYLALVNRIRVIMLYERIGQPAREHRA